MPSSQTLCSGSGGCGALTQLVSVGALNKYLDRDATYSFWRTRYHKHTPFALDAVTQPFNSSLQFGSEAHVTLNRNGDLLYYQYVMIQLPGIVAVECNGGENCSQFPSVPNPCNPCAEADRACFEKYLANDENYARASEAQKQQMLRKAKDAWSRDKYNTCASLECCEEAEDCPSTICGPELGGVYAYWTNAIGMWLIEQARLVIGGSPIDTLWNVFLFAWEELTGKSGRRLTELTGRRFTRSSLLCDSRRERTLWVPLPWWFTNHSGCALPLCSMLYHGVQLQITFEQLRNCICVSGPNVTVKNCATGAPIVASDLRAFIESTYVYLDVPEREKFTGNQFECLVVQNQYKIEQARGSQHVVKLNWNHPIIEIMFFIRRICNERSNNWFNFSGVDNRDPVVSASLFLNNQARIGAKPGPYFRLVQPYQHHSNIPDCFIYVFSFALAPESDAPSGSCNFSRIDNVELTIQLQEELANEQCTVMCIGRNWNVLRFKNGMAGVAYST